MGETVRGGAFNLSSAAFASERRKWSSVEPDGRSFRLVLVDDLLLDDLPPRRGSGLETLFLDFRYGVERGQILPGNR